jgi:hypothetical protein
VERKIGKWNLLFLTFVVFVEFRYDMTVLSDKFERRDAENFVVKAIITMVMTKKKIEKIENTYLINLCTGVPKFANSKSRAL